MKNKGSSAGGIVFRAIGFLMAGVMLSMVFLGTIDTQSWFYDKTTANMEVAAATTEDIISFIGVDDKENPQEIILEGSSNLQHDATIYFAVEGDIDEYILHINPVKIQANKQYKIPIEPNLNTYQYVKLLEWPWQNGKVTGRIRVKYLNEFVKEDIEISFTKKYLRQRIIDEIERRRVEITSVEDSEEARGEITTLITYLASHLKWQKEDNDVSFLNGDSKSEKRSSIQTYNQLGFQSKEGIQLELEKVPIEKLELNEDQSKIIEIIAPTLQKYLDKLYEIVVNLVDKINEKIIVIAGLEKEKDELNKSLEEARKEIENLKNENQRLTEENYSLQREIERLQLELSIAQNASYQGSGGGSSTPPTHEEKPSQDEETGEIPKEEVIEAPEEDVDEGDEEIAPIEDETGETPKEEVIEAPEEEEDVDEGDEEIEAPEEEDADKGDSQPDLGNTNNGNGDDEVEDKTEGDPVSTSVGTIEEADTVGSDVPIDKDG